MMRFATFTALLLGTALRAAAQTADPAEVAAILERVRATTTTVQQFNLFSGREYVFDFNEGVGTTGGAGGNLTVANVADFPFLYGKGMALSVGRLGPCGLASPHYHPRAAEFLYMLTGDSLQVGFILENGARLVQGTLAPSQGFVFPKNSFHYQSNTGCNPVTFVAGWNHEDPGAAHVGQRFFGIPPNITDATLGDVGLDEVVRIAKSVPDSFALGVQTCLQKCNIQRGDQPKTQQQPRVLGNGFPTGAARRDLEELNNFNKRSEVPETSEEPVTRSSTVASLLSSANAQTLQEIAFLLKAVIGVLLSGYVFAWLYFVVPAWKNRRLQANGGAIQIHDVKA
jgi:oxalate decarboxylase/phosphoglucose isomerase-like protein (cupin superfamily)